MLTYAILYLVLALGTLVALAGMILKIGNMLGGCPQAVRAARAAGVTIATGYAAIGGGGVILIGAVLPVLADAPLMGLMLALGFAALCLGLGFAHAIGTLRAVVLETAPRADAKAVAA